jgi:hypothetical protein
MIETTCIRCERLHRPSRDDFRAGCWRVCPACRERPPARGATGHAGQSQALSRSNNAQKVSSSWPHARRAGR